MTKAISIRFERSASGRLVAYPTSEAAALFARLTATPTLPGESLAIAKELGFEIKVEPSEAGSAASLAAYINRDGRAS